MTILSQVNSVIDLEKLMKTIKRIICFAMALICLSLSLVSCADRLVMTGTGLTNKKTGIAYSYVLDPAYQPIEHAKESYTKWKYNKITVEYYEIAGLSPEEWLYCPTLGEVLCSTGEELPGLDGFEATGALLCIEAAIPYSIYEITEQEFIDKIVARYLEIKENPNGDFVPHTYIFGAKAASGYFMAKKIISFICAMADLINNDPDMKGRLKVVYLEDYNVTMAEKLMPAADISEQISLAGTEASGTGNMKLMINGALTLGTLDGANVEIHEAVTEENMFLFGMTTPEVEDLKRRGYVPSNYLSGNAELRKIIAFIQGGINGKQFPEIANIVNHDPYMVLADFADYRAAQKKIDEVWKDREKWNRMSLLNTAGAGRFATDRAINDYARDIWDTKPVR